MFRRLWQWAKKASKEMRNNMIRTIITKHVIKFLTGTAGMSILFTIYGIVRNNYFIFMSTILVALNILILWIVFYKKYKLELPQKMEIFPENSAAPIEKGFISLREVVLALDKNEKISQNKELLDMMKRPNMTRDQYLIQYNIQEYLTSDLYGNEVILREISPQKIKIPSYEYLSQKSNGSIGLGDNKWGKDCNSLCSAQGEVLYTNVSVKESVFKNILEKQNAKFFEMEQEA